MKAKKKASKKKATVSLRAFERNGKTVALFAVSLAVAPYYYTFLRGGMPLPWLISLLAVPLLLFLGHGMQSAFARLIGAKREGGSAAYEDLVKRFKPEQAALPITLAILIGFLGMKAIDGAMKAYADATTGVLYDPKSMIPFLCGVGIGATVILGIVLWFYPYNRILSMRMVIPFGVVFAVNFFVNLIMNGIPTRFLACCFLLFVPLYLFALNRGYLVKAVDRSGTGQIGPDMLRFNGALSGVLSLCFLALFGLLVVIVTGVTTLARIGFFALFRASMGDGDEWESGDEKMDRFTDFVFGKGEGGAFMIGSNAAAGLFILFLFLAIIFLGLFLLFRFRRDLFRAFRKGIKRLIGNILHFLRTALDLWNGALIEEKEDKKKNDYVDTSVKMAQPTPHPSDRGLSARNWRQVLAGIDSPVERNRFLYRLTVKRMERFLALRVSDTPKQIEDKANARLNCPEMPLITETFVAYRYAGKAHVPKEETTLAAQDAMCKLIDRLEEGDA